jgi:heme-degrading monooxygenase HmoA
MVARIWNGRVPLAKSAAYLKLMLEVALPDYQGTAGNLGAFVLHRCDPDAAHFITLTFWASFDSIKNFAGEHSERAKYYDFDANYLLEMNPTVQHYTVYDGKPIT